MDEDPCGLGDKLGELEDVVKSCRDSEGDAVADELKSISGSCFDRAAVCVSSWNKPREGSFFMEGVSFGFGFFASGSVNHPPFPTNADPVVLLPATI